MSSRVNFLRPLSLEITSITPWTPWYPSVRKIFFGFTKTSMAWKAERPEEYETTLVPKRVLRTISKRLELGAV
jgi:hypothetical protein